MAPRAANAAAPKRAAAPKPPPALPPRVEEPPPPKPRQPEAAPDAGGWLGEVPPVVEVPIGDPNAREVAQLATREIIGAGRLAGGRLVVILYPAHVLPVRAIPPEVREHLRRIGAAP